jgi:regulator of RNase E activity RraA
VVAAFRTFPTTVVSDQLDRLNAAHGIHRISDGSLGILAGPVVSVRVPPGDNLGIYVAAEHAEPGDILVVDAGGETRRAVMGEIFYRHLASRGIGGIVIDGVVRDVEALRDGPMAVFARGAIHLGPTRNGPGDVHDAACVGGAIVRTGDIVVGDDDGVVVVPNHRIAETLRGAKDLLEREAELIERARTGRMDLAWLRDVEQIPVAPSEVAEGQRSD